MNTGHYPSFIQISCFNSDRKPVDLRPNEPVEQLVRAYHLIDTLVKAQAPFYHGGHTLNPIFINGYVHIPAASYIFDCIQTRVPGRPSIEELKFCMRDINAPPTLDAITGLHATLWAVGIRQTYINTDIYWWLLQYAKRPLSLAEFSMIAYRCHLDGKLVQHMMENQAHIALDDKLPDIIPIADWCFASGLSIQLQKSGLKAGAKRAKDRARLAKEAEGKSMRHGGKPSKVKRTEERQKRFWPALGES